MKFDFQVTFHAPNEQAAHEIVKPWADAVRASVRAERINAEKTFAALRSSFLFPVRPRSEAAERERVIEAKLIEAKPEPAPEPQPPARKRAAAASKTTRPRISRAHVHPALRNAGKDLEEAPAGIRNVLEDQLIARGGGTVRRTASGAYEIA